MAGEYIEFSNSEQPAINDTNLNLLQQLIKQDIQGAASGDTLPIGAILPFGSDTIPENWLLCDGSAVSRTTYQTLFNTIGTTYGQGDGFTTFNLPDLRGRVGVGKSSDAEFDTLGETGGEKKHTLTVDEMPSHTHDALNYTSGYSGGSQIDFSTLLRGYTIATSVPAVKSTGGGQAHNILQPYIVTNYIIKAYQSAGVVATVVDNLTSTSSTDALSAKQGKILNDRSIYSTTETVVGTWIDGKPLYRKVYSVSSKSNIDLSGLNYDFIEIVSTTMNVSGYRRNPYYTSSSDYFRTLINNSKNLIIETSASSINNWTTVLQYTKTTD